MELPTSLETDRLTLRLFEEADAPAYQRLLDESREHLTRSLGWGPERFENAAGQIRELRERHRAKIAVPLGIFAKDGGFLGAIGLVRPDWEAGSCEIGIWLGVGALGQGVASEAARALILATARKRDNGEDVAMDVSMCKYFATEMCGRVADRVVQIFGGQGYVKAGGIERFYRDVRAFRIYEGTSQIHQLNIAGHLLRHG